jgi:catechol 2,3-dioxygenase-like lactoylglutathione lyase family enzyme
MKRIHIAIATQDIAATVPDYTQRFGIEPVVVVPGEYALWRTPTLNFSVRQDSTCEPGTLRHLGWEDEAAQTFTTDTDCNSILWEHFAAQHQAAEINDIWPNIPSVVKPSAQGFAD